MAVKLNLMAHRLQHLTPPLTSQRYQKAILVLLLFFVCSLYVSIASAQQLPKSTTTELSTALVKKKNLNTVHFKAKSDENFMLAADYYQGKKDSSGVIVLHDCQHSRVSYTQLSKSIAEQGLHVLSVDFRGYGESISEHFSQKKIKKQATDIVSYQNEISFLTSFWQEDLLSSYHYLLSKMDKHQTTSIIASGCSASYAVALAEKFHLKSLVMITPEMTYGDKERYKNLIDIPSYFINSSYHVETYSTVKELFAWNGSSYSKMQIFKGNNTNVSLLKIHKGLNKDISQWLKSIH
ncbi:MAG: hypothetical protein OCD00_10220 [Colwellia sp.]